MCTHLDKTGSTYYFRRPVPKDLAGYFLTKTGKPRTEWKFSLGTKDREEAKRLLRPHVISTDSLIDEARASLTTAAAPVDSAAMQRVREEEEAMAALAEQQQQRRSNPIRRQARILWRQRMRMSTAELSPEEAAIVDLLREGQVEGLALLEERVKKMTEERAPRPSVSITALFEDFAKSGAAKPHTVVKWRAAVTAFVKYLGHDNAAAVKRADVSGWLKALVAEGLSVRTVQGTYRAAVARVFKLAHNDGLLPNNVAAAIEVRGPKAIKTKRDDISDEDAEAILNAALGPHEGRISKHFALALRWVPWICAYTGARIAELTQLRACDIRQESGIWVFHITPEAGSVKTDEFRTVPVHSHLIEQGVLQLAVAGSESPLFYDPTAARNPAAIQKQPQQLGSKLGMWVRALGVTEVASPNHGWRHRFKTTARLVGIPADVRDAIQGHAARAEGEKYGTQPIAVLKEAIERLPRYEISRLDKRPQ